MLSERIKVSYRLAVRRSHLLQTSVRKRFPLRPPPKGSPEFVIGCRRRSRTPGKSITSDVFFFTSKCNNNININNSILARSHNAFKKTSCSTRRSLHTPKHGNYTRGTTADYNRLKRVSLICRYYYY